MRAALYVRVSSQEQKLHGLSVDSQIDALTKYCEEHEIIIAGIYNDAGISARKAYTRRPALLKMLNDCTQGLIDIILFTKLDRFFRSVSGFYHVQEVLDKAKVPWKAIWEDYTTEDSSGVFKVNIMLAVAQAESDRTSERVKAIVEYRKAQGKFVGRAPTGYIKKNDHLFKDPAAEAGMNALFRAYLETASAYQALRAAADEGLMLEYNHVYSILKKPCYYGDASGSVCEPYVTKEEWDRIQSLGNKGPRKPKVPDRVYLFTGLLTCGYCNRRMPSHPHHRTNKHGRSYNWISYDCFGSRGAVYRCPSVYVREEKLEAYLLNELESLFEGYKLKTVSVTDRKSDAEATKKKLESKLARLKELYIEGDISKDDYLIKKKEIEDSLSQLRFISAPSLPDLPPDWKSVYAELSPKGRQQYWRSIIDHISVFNNDDGTKRYEVTFL